MLPRRSDGTVHIAILTSFRSPRAVGRPIRVEKNEKPTVEQLDALHQHYMEELSNLFDQHKTAYGVEKDTYLNFVWVTSREASVQSWDCSSTQTGWGFEKEVFYLKLGRLWFMVWNELGLAGQVWSFV